MPDRDQRQVSDADFQALAGFRYTLRLFFRFSEQAAAAQGLTSRQYQVLLAVRGWAGAEPMSIGDLAERLQIRHHSAVGLVQRLVKAGLLRRDQLPADRRRAVLTPTPRGLKVLESLATAHRAELRRVRHQLEALLDSL